MVVSNGFRFQERFLKLAGEPPALIIPHTATYTYIQYIYNFSNIYIFTYKVSKAFSIVCKETTVQLTAEAPCLIWLILIWSFNFTVIRARTGILCNGNMPFSTAGPFQLKS